MTDEYAEALRDAITAVVLQYLPEATDGGRVSGFLLSFDWVDVGPTSGEQVVVVDRDPVVALRALRGRFIAGSEWQTECPTAPRPRPSFQYRRRTDPPAPPEPDW